MRTLLFCVALLVSATSTASASTIPQSDPSADYTTVPGCVSGMCAAGPRFLIQVFIGPLPRGNFRSDQKAFNDDLTVTVTSGPTQGFLSPCLFASADWFQGFASASASFGRSFLMPITRGGGGDTCGPPSVLPESFTLGVPQSYEINLSASASAGSNFSDSAQADAMAGFEGLLFSDSSGHPIDVSFSVGEAPIPEPSSRSLLLCGLITWALLRLAAGLRCERDPDVAAGE